MVVKRNRTRPTLEERLLTFAEDARAAAMLIAPSKEKRELLRKAERAETLAKATDRLTSNPSFLDLLNRRADHERHS